MANRIQKLNYIGIALTVGIFVLVMARLDWTHLFSLMKNIDLRLALAAFLMMVLQIIFLAARWDILINLDRPKISTAQVYRICFVASMSNFVFVSAISGMVLRLAMSVQGGVPWVRAVCATLIDRLLSLGVLVAIVGLFLPFSVAYATKLPMISDIPLIFCVLGAMGLSAVLFMIRHPRWVQNIVGIRRYKKTQLYLVRLFRGKNALKVLAYSFVAQMCFFLGVYFILSASGAQIGFFSMMLVIPLISLLSSLPITIAGWGVREGLFVVALPLLHVRVEIAFMAALQVGFYTMFAAILLGLPLLLDRKFTRDLKGLIAHSSNVIQHLKRK